MKRRDFLIAGSAAALAACAPNRRPTDAAAPATSAGGASSTAAATTGVPVTTASTTAPSTTEHATTTPSTTAPRGPAAFVQHGLRTKTQIALTFHANGDVGLTTKLFTDAEARNVPLTIFAVGSWLVTNPTMSARILKGGHELANHTYTHPSLGQMAAAAVSVEITKCRDVIKTQTGQLGGWFRPSGIDVPTALILNEAGKAGYSTVIGYDVDPLDYQDPGAAAVLQRVKTGMQAGSIVSLHTGHQGTVDALPGILDAIATASLQPVTVSTLLS